MHPDGLVAGVELPPALCHDNKMQLLRLGKVPWQERVKHAPFQSGLFALWRIANGPCAAQRVLRSPGAQVP